MDFTWFPIILAYFGIGWLLRICLERESKYEEREDMMLWIILCWPIVVAAIVTLTIVMMAMAVVNSIRKLFM